MKKVIALLLAVSIISSLAGCSEDVKPVVTVSSTSTTDTTKATETTAIIIVIDDKGETLTQADGTPVTSAVKKIPTKVVTVTDKSGEAVTEKNGTAVTRIVTPPTIPPKKDTDNTDDSKPETERNTSIEQENSKSDNSETYKPKPKTTKRISYTKKPTTTKRTTTTKKATTTKKRTTTTTKKKTTTKPTKKDPWRYPYDLKAIYADCKKEIERLGMVWKDSLRIDNSGWTGGINTVAFTNFPDLYLKNKIFEVIKHEHKINTRSYCRVWFQPIPDSLGNYNCYFLEEY